MTTLQTRLAAALGQVLPITAESDGALTIHHDGTLASLRVVTIAEGLDLVSLTQILAWDLPAHRRLRDTVADHAHNTQLGTVTLVERTGRAAGNSGKTADVMLRYNFPGTGLGDDALRVLVLLVLENGAEIGRTLTG